MRVNGVSVCAILGLYSNSSEWYSSASDDETLICCVPVYSQPHD